MCIVNPCEGQCGWAASVFKTDARIYSINSLRSIFGTRLAQQTRVSCRSRFSTRKPHCYMSCQRLLVLRCGFYLPHGDTGDTHDQQSQPLMWQSLTPHIPNGHLGVTVWQIQSVGSKDVSSKSPVRCTDCRHVMFSPGSWNGFFMVVTDGHIQ